MSRLSESRGAGALRREWWHAFSEAARERGSLRHGRLRDEGYLNVDLGLSLGSTIVMARCRKREVGVQVLFDEPTALTIFESLLASRAQVEAVIPAPVVWGTPSGRSRTVEVRREGDLASPAEWPELVEWLLSMADALRHGLAPLLGLRPARLTDRRWSPSSFFAELAELNPSSSGPATALYQWSREAMPGIYWGKGRQYGSFLPGLRHEGFVHRVMSVWTSGVFVLRFPPLVERPPFDRLELRSALLERLNSVPLFRLPPEVLALYPSLPLPMLGDGRVLAGFLDVLEWYADNVRQRRPRWVLRPQRSTPDSGPSRPSTRSGCGPERTRQ